MPRDDSAGHGHPRARSSTWSPTASFLSNVRGIPEPVVYAQETIRNLLGKKPNIRNLPRPPAPLPGAGGKTFSSSSAIAAPIRPVQNLEDSRVEITCQNHGFAVGSREPARRAVSDPRQPQRQQRSRASATRRWPAFSVQYHPEASSGPPRQRLPVARFKRML